MAEGRLNIELRLDAKLKRELAKRAEKGFGPIENFLYAAAMGEITESVVVDVFRADPETGKRVRCKEVQEVSPSVKDRVGAAKAWKELVVDKRAADKKEMSKPSADVPTRKITAAVRAVAERKRLARGDVQVVPGGKR